MQNWSASGRFRVDDERLGFREPSSLRRAARRGDRRLLVSDILR